MKMNTGAQNAHRRMGGILSVWLGIGLVRFLRLGVLANLIGAPLADRDHRPDRPLVFGITRGWWRHRATR
jgi:hypothetical protein